MEINDQEVLASIIREAGRQADFYDRKGSNHLAIAWSELEALAFAARKQRLTLILGCKEKIYPNPIKGGE